MSALPITFAATWPLLFLLGIPLLWWAGRRTRTNLARRHLAVITALRCAAVALAALALARPVWHAATDDLSVVFALDVSGSVSGGFVAGSLEWIERAQSRMPSGQSRIVAFADRPVVLGSADEVRALEVRAGAGNAGTIDRNATNIEQALDAALLALDRDRVKRVVLFTDGNETAGDLRRVMPALMQENVRVYPLIARMRDDARAWIDGIDAPAEVREGEPVVVSVRVYSPSAARANVRLQRGGEQLGSRGVMLDAGINAVDFEVRLRGAGAATLEATVQAPGAAIGGNDRSLRTVWVGPRPRVLYVEGQTGSARYLREALEAERIDTTVAGPGAMPSTAAELLRYDAVILSDAPARALAEPQMRALESYVRDHGGGFLFAGGENTFGEEGYSGSTVEKILPVEFKAQERRDMALVIAMDRSYSMRGRKIEYAKEAARAALDLLEEQHRFGVVAFDSRPHIAVPMQDARAKRRAEDQISRIQASGQTNIYPALGTVLAMLEGEPARTKHVILLSDGETQTADFPMLIARMREAGIMLSTVTLGKDGDVELMKQLAELGGGRHYLATAAEAIPKIFVEETRKITRDNLKEEAVRAVVRRPMAALRGVDFDGAPALRGHVATQPRDTAEVILATADGAPLLTRWQFGLGKAVMFSSDVKNRWAADWLSWPGYGKLWSQLVRETMRRESGESLDLRVSREGGEAVITLGLLGPDGGFRIDAMPRVRVMRGVQPAEEVALRQVGPGLFAARTALGMQDVTSFTLVPRGGISAEAAARAGTRALHPRFSDEYRLMPPNIALLNALAEETGGRVGAGIDEVLSAGTDRGLQVRELWSWLAAAALLLFLLDILLRRAPVAWRWLGS